MGHFTFFYSIRLRTNDVVLTIAWTSLVFPTLRVTFKTSLSFNGKIKWIRICREASLLPRGMFEIFPLQYFNAVLTSSLLNEVDHWPAVVISHVPCFLMSSYKKYLGESPEHQYTLNISLVSLHCLFPLSGHRCYSSSITEMGSPPNRTLNTLKRNQLDIVYLQTVSTCFQR